MAQITSPSSQLSAGEIPIKDRLGVKYLIDNEPNMQKLPLEYVLPLPENPLLATYAQIPVIDLSGLDGPAECRKSTVQAICSACAEWGFFGITNHGIKISLMEDMLKVAQEFFDLPIEDKMKYSSDDVMSLWRYGTSLNTSAKHALHWRDFFRHHCHPLEDSLHLWPDNPPNYRQVVIEYTEEIWQLALKVAGAVSEGLGLDRDFIEKSIGKRYQLIASNYYPRCPEPDKTLGLAAHSDHGGLVFLMQNDVDGLQIKHNERWVSVKSAPGNLLVNLGDYVEILSNGRYKSIEHRAVVNSEKTRITVVSGLGPELTATIAPATALVDDKSEMKYKPITYKDYILYQQTITSRGKSALLALAPEKAVGG